MLMIIYQDSPLSGRASTLGSLHDIVITKSWNICRLNISNGIIRILTILHFCNLNQMLIQSNPYHRTVQQTFVTVPKIGRGRITLLLVLLLSANDPNFTSRLHMKIIHNVRIRDWKYFWLSELTVSSRHPKSELEKLAWTKKSEKWFLWWWWWWEQRWYYLADSFSFLSVTLRGKNHIAFRDNKSEKYFNIDGDDNDNNDDITAQWASPS